MLKQGHKLRVSSSYTKKIISFVLVTLITLPSTLYSAVSTTNAQTASSSATPKPQTSTSQIKDTVRNFKINLNDYSSFGTDCSQKSTGDANCDGKINEFDLSLWEIEFNSPNSPKRSDFNKDGAITLLDYGIWRRAAFSRESGSLNKFLAFISSISNPKSVIYNLQSLIINNIYAQETASGGSEINSSQTFSGSGASLIVNNLSDGNTQQLNFDSNGNPQTAAFYNSNGSSYAEIAFSALGSTIISTQSNGIPVSVNKTASGPIVENFRNTDGTLLALKSWPTQESYDRNEPPLSVTIPGQGSTREILNMQPNGDAIIEKSDAAGNIMKRSQLRSNGTTITEDFQNSINVQSNSKIGFTTLSMKNNIGGNTQYMFYRGELYAIIQTKDSTTTYISTPLDESGNSWNFQTVNGGNKTEKVVTNPIAEANGGTVDPNSLIQYINYYKQSTPAAAAVNFSDSYTSTAPGIKNPVDKANAILTISQTQAPAVLGIIKEALARESGWQQTKNETSNSPEGQFSTQTQNVVFENSRENSTPEVISVSVTTPTGSGNANDPGNVSVNINGVAATVPRNDLPSNFQSAPSLETLSSFIESVRSTPDGASLPNTPASLSQSTPTAPDPAAPTTPEAPSTTSGNWAADQRADSKSSSETLNAAATAAGAAASNTAGDVTTRANAAKDAYTNAFNAQYSQSFQQNGVLADIRNDPQAAGIRDTNANFAAIQSYVAITNPGIVGSQGVNEALWNAPIGIAARNAAIRDLGLTGLVQQSQVPPPGAFTTTTGASVGATVPAAAAAASAASGIPEPQSGLMADGIHTSTVASLGDGNYESTITDASGNIVATQTHNPDNLTSSWNDVASGETYNSYGGELASMTQGDSIVGISAQDNSLVAVGDSSYVNDQGYIEGGRPATQEEVDSWNQQAREQAAATGVDQYGFSFDSDGNLEASKIGSIGNDSGTCFLPGTLISTPSGPKAIETLTPGDKVFSYNEKAETKEISDFKELSINLVDEYLIINGQIKATTYHPFYILSSSRMRGSNKQLQLNESKKPSINQLITLRADQLQLGDILLNEQGQHIPVYSIEKVSAKRTTVYNLNNVTKNNNFFAQGILVHNYDNAGGGDYSDPGNQDISSEAY